MTVRTLLPAFFCALALMACGNDPGTAAEVALAEIASRQQVYDGRTLRVRGTVRGFHDPRHYWLEDDDRNRVGLEPEELIAPHLGREVTIVGRYSFAHDRGRRITITSIDPFDERR